MNTSHGRLNLYIDIFELPNQHARALPDLTPAELVEAILQEFRELEYLGADPQEYALLTENGMPLNDEEILAKQLEDQAKLVLTEKEIEIPQKTQKLAKNVYLRETNTNQVYRIRWQPAFIGRPDKNQPNNDWLAVNLESHLRGLRVSRRHAVITERNGEYYIEPLSQNPTIVIRPDNTTQTLGTNNKVRLNPGDSIRLERSNITLKFLVQPDQIQAMSESDKLHTIAD